MRTLKEPVYASWSLTFALLGDTFLYAFLPVHAFSVQVPVLWIGVLLLQADLGIIPATVTAWVAGFLLFRRIGSIVLSPAGGWLADRYGFEKVYAGSLSFIAVGLLLLSLGWVSAGLLTLFAFYSVNSAMAAGASTSSSHRANSAMHEGKSTSPQFTHLVAENVAWRDAGAAIGALIGGFLISWGWVHYTLFLSSFVLSFFLAWYVGMYRQSFKNKFLWK